MSFHFCERSFPRQPNRFATSKRWRPRSESKIFICSKPKPVLMFNMYTKLTTALGAFALLISGGAGVNVRMVKLHRLLGQQWRLSFRDLRQLNDVGANIFTGGAGRQARCLAPGDYTFIGIDSFGDGWNGASAEFYNSGALIGELAVEGGQGSVVPPWCRRPWLHRSSSRQLQPRSH